MAHIDTFTSSSTWTCPQGVTSVDVECWAGGGSACSTNGGNVGQGGAGGAYSKKTGITVVAGTVYTVTVGQGGTSVATGAGNAGGDSWFLDATTVLAKGGQGGQQTGGFNSLAAAQGGQASAGIGTTKWSGGNSGACNASGGPQFAAGGGGAGDSANGGNGSDFNTGTPGAGGSNFGGSAGTTTGAAGNTFSGGGMPGSTSGAGARGELHITYTVNVTVTIADTVGTTDAISSQTNYTVTAADVIATTDAIVTSNRFKNARKPASGTWTDNTKTP